MLGFTYTAHSQCQTGDCQNGTGTKRMSDGSIYVGAFKNKLREGQGKLTKKNGDVLEGLWHNDRLNGEASLTKANGDSFVGNWRNNSRYGIGKYNWANGSSYVGEWYSNRRYGKGVMNYANGNVYNGQWVDDQYSGTGSFEWKSGETFAGTWDKNLPKKGVFAFSTGQKYEGSWKTHLQKGKTALEFIASGKKIASWLDGNIEDIRPANLKQNAVADTIDEHEEVEDLNTETDKVDEVKVKNTTTKDTNTTTPDKADAFSKFEKKYHVNFNMVMRELEAEKQFLLERGIKIRDEIDLIARRLESESFSNDEKMSLEAYLKSLEEALVENELAFQDARQKTTDVINRMRNTILEQDTKIEVIEAKNTKGQEQLRFFAFTSTLAIAICFVLFMIYRKIDNQKGEIQGQNVLIAKKNQDITASLNYARRIQMAALPPNAKIYQALPESFIFFEPRDIVSGDFYWFTQIDQKTFIAAIDCTGHGVPGAFMSLIGNKLLNEIIVTRQIHDVAEILNQLHQGIFTSLKQEENTSQDGMDISLCVIDRLEQTLEFSGASHPLFIIQNEKLQEIKGDRLHIGGLQKSQASRDFSKKVITLDPVNKQTFYLFSDGFRDQFGDDGGKYGKRRFKELLLEIHQQPMRKQRISLREELLNWKGSQKQLDDVLVIGFQT